MKHLLFLCTLLLCSSVRAQFGCTDPQATNYNSNAKDNDGSCIYKKTSFSPIKLCSKLSDTISETSGLIHFDNQFWTLNDSDNPPALYAFDSLKGFIRHITFIRNQANKDWEDLAQDAQHIYIGEFGNNGGSRKDLRIYKIRKSDIDYGKFTDTVDAETIRFNMADQTDFTDNFINNDFDMEAMIFKDDSLHLFSKNWIDKKTRHYVCPIDSGEYSLSPVETIEVDGQISGAGIGENGTVVLIGYTKPLYPCFVWLFWDYKNNRFNTGNRRRIELGNTLFPGQIEGITIRGKRTYISNENKIATQQLTYLNYERWTDSSRFNSIEDTFIERTTVSYSNGFLHINSLDLQDGMKIDIYDQNGSKVLTQILDMENNQAKIGVSELPMGIYFVKCSKTLLGKVLIEN